MQRIPLPDVSNYKMFDDVFDYLETMRKNRGEELSRKNTLEQAQKHFEETKAFEREKMNLENKLEHEKLSELSNYHGNNLALKQKLAEMKAAELTGGKKLSAQERTQRMKLLESGRNSIGIINKSNELEKILNENPNLTGFLPYLKNKFGQGGKALGNYTTKAAELQAQLTKLAGQRGGIQLVKWAKEMKPNEWKDVESNIGNVQGSRETATQDLADIADEYETITGEKFPLSATAMPQANGNVTKWKMVNGNWSRTSNLT